MIKKVNYLPINPKTKEVIVWRNGNTGIQRDLVPIEKLSLKEINSIKLFSREEIKKELQALKENFEGLKALKVTLLLEEASLIG